jgi:hypothetical protein
MASEHSKLLYNFALTDRLTADIRLHFVPLKFAFGELRMSANRYTISHRIYDKEKRPLRYWILKLCVLCALRGDKSLDF